MIDDIYSVETFVQIPQNIYSFKLYYIETLVPTSFEFSTHALATGFVEILNTTLRNCLSDQAEVTGVRVRQVHSDAGGVHNPPHTRTWSTGTATTFGTVSSPALPGQLTLNLRLFQSTFGAKSDGRVFISGIPENQVENNLVLATFLSGPVKSFTDLLGWQAGQEIQASGDTATFKLGMISAKAAYAPIQAWIDGGMVGPKPGRDYGGAFAEVTGIERQSIIGGQRRRIFRTVGSATLLGA